MKVFDCFTFFNELELLDLRLMAMYDNVDYLILVEADKTHRGEPKEFIFELNKRKFEKYLDKLVYIKVKDLPLHKGLGDWAAENFQRNCINRALDDLAVEDDIILVSDIDEIPNYNTVSEHFNEKEFVTLVHRLYYYYVNCSVSFPWYGPVMYKYKHGILPNDMRNLAAFGPRNKVVLEGGWHYSYTGGPLRIKKKINSIVEGYQIADRVGTVEDIMHKMTNQEDLWNRKDENFSESLIDVSDPVLAPSCILDFIEKYPSFYFNKII